MNFYYTSMLSALCPQHLQDKRQKEKDKRIHNE